MGRPLAQATAALRLHRMPSGDCLCPQIPPVSTSLTLSLPPQLPITPQPALISPLPTPGARAPGLGRPLCRAGPPCSSLAPLGHAAFQSVPRQGRIWQHWSNDFCTFR